MALKLREKREPCRGAQRKKQGDAWRTLRSGHVRVLQSESFRRLPWLVHGFSTRVGGVSLLERPAQALNLSFTDWDNPKNVESNRAKLLIATGARGMALVTLRQIHSDIVHVVDSPPALPPRGDAVISRTPGLLLAVQTADCVPVLLADKRRGVVAAVHAGWRGTLGRIVSKTVGHMRMAFGSQPRDVVAGLGPAIGRCCYEVGPEVAQGFAAQFPQARDWFDGPFDQLATGEEPNPFRWLSMIPPGHDPPPPSVQLDLWAANRWQLLDAGVPESQILSSDLCTACHTDLLFSHRKESGRTGRLMAVIGIKP
jgi:purine-nucleoside/S-methyl-5'-thioadenosine phosphorylase / adenosine deaminase